MIISSLAKFNAISNANNAAYNMMMYSNNLVNLSTFSGMQSTQNVQSIQQVQLLDKKMMSEILKNQLFYKTSIQESKSLDKMA